MAWLAVANPPCVVDTFDGEVVALNLETGSYFSMPGLAGAIWQDLAAGHASDDIVHEIATADQALGEEARRLVASVQSHGLMREVPRPAAAPGAPLFRGVLAGGAREISFLAFDDMKDLVMTDPIHDVDQEAGWPTPAKT